MNLEISQVETLYKENGREEQWMLLYRLEDPEAGVEPEF